jgi:hypothetical protein
MLDRGRGWASGRRLIDASAPSSRRRSTSPTPPGRRWSAAATGVEVLACADELVRE